MRRLLLLGLSVLILGQAGLAQEKIEIRLRMRKGDVYLFENSATVRQQVKMTAPGQDGVELGQTVTAMRKGKFAVLAAEGGVPTSLKVTYDAKENFDKVETAGQPAAEKPFALAGKAVTVARDAEGTLKCDAGEPVDEKTRQELASVLVLFTQYLPKGPVAPGDEWDADPQALAREFGLGPTERAATHCKLFKVGGADEGNERAAYIAVTTAVTKHPQPGFEVTVDAKGMARIELASATLGAKLTGKTLARGTQQMPGPDENAVALRVEAAGTIESSSTISLVQNVGAGGAETPKVPAAGADAYVGTFKDARMTVEIQRAEDGYKGTIRFGERQLPFAARVVGAGLQGAFESEGNRFAFTASLEGATLTFTTGTTTYRLTKQAANPLEAPRPANPLDRPPRPLFE